MKRSPILAVAASLVAALVVAGCGGDETSPAPESPATATTEATVADPITPAEATPTKDDTIEGAAPTAGAALDVTATDGAFDGLPDELPAGAVTVTLTNESEAIAHDLALVKVTEETTPDQVVEALGSAMQGGPIPDYLEGLTGTTSAPPGGSITQTFSIEPGQYYAASFGSEEGEGPPEEGSEPPPPAFAQGMLQPLTVTEGEAELPESDATITAVDYGFEVDVPDDGAQEITFRNDGPLQLHHAVLVGFGDVPVDEARTTLQEVLTSEEEGPPPEGVDFEVGESAVFSSGLGGTFEATLEPGNTYAVVCFISDRAGGPPHAFGHDMIEVFTVGGETS